jgi:hypothetical protein
MPATKYDYEAFLPHHTASKHRIMALTESLDEHDQLHAVATVSDELTARRLSDALNSWLLGRRNHADRLTAALAGLPDSVQAAIRQLPIDPDAAEIGALPLAAQLRTEPIDGILLFPTTACAPGRCGVCTDCADDCRSCSICNNEDGHPCEDCMPPDLTPRTALALAMAGDVLADQCFDVLPDPQDPQSGGDRDWLPLPNLLHKQTDDFMRRMARCFDDLVADLRNGLRPEPRNIAEELALHLMIERADVYHTDEPELLESYEPLIPATRHDNDFLVLIDTLLVDADHFGYLDHTDIPAAPGTLDDELFTPFQDDHDRDPNRGYRR